MIAHGGHSNFYLDDLFCVNQSISYFLRVKAADMNSLKILAITTALFFSSFHLATFAQQEPTVSAVAAATEKKQVELNEDEMNSLLVGKKVTYQTTARLCRMDIDKDKTFVNYCGSHTDKGTWFIKDPLNGKSKQFCRVSATDKNLERCNVILKIEDGEIYFGSAPATRSKIVKVEPL